MKFIDEYRDPEKVKSLLREIESVVTRNWVIMEICGGQTHAFLHHGLDDMFPPQIELVHGPGCPVCVTPLEQIDKAIAIASRPEVIFTSYGDMLRVPGSSKDLFAVRASGGNVKVVYSPLEAVQIAEANPDKQKKESGNFGEKNEDVNESKNPAMRAIRNSRKMPAAEEKCNDNSRAGDHSSIFA